MGTWGRDIRYDTHPAVALAAALLTMAAALLGGLPAQAQPETSDKPRFFPSLFVFSDT